MAFAVFPILDVAESCGLVIDKNFGKMEIKINCPFCGDNKKQMYLNTAKNKFFCFRCGKGGSSISLYAQMNHLDFYMALDALKKGTLLHLRLVPAMLIARRKPRNL